MPLAPEYLHMIHPGVVFHALLYGRNSRDPKKRGRPVEAQLTDGRDLCNRFDWHITEEFKDVGLSASRHARREAERPTSLNSSVMCQSKRLQRSRPSVSCASTGRPRFFGSRLLRP